LPVRFAQYNRIGNLFVFVPDAKGQAIKSFFRLTTWLPSPNIPRFRATGALVVRRRTKSGWKSTELGGRRRSAPQSHPLRRAADERCGPPRRATVDRRQSWRDPGEVAQRRHCTFNKAWSNRWVNRQPISLARFLGRLPT